MLNIANTYFRNLRKLSNADFKTLCLTALNRGKIRQDIINGDVYIVENVLDREMVSRILQIALDEKRSPASSTAIIEGIDNIYYISNNLKAKIGDYTAIDRSWYFFPWNVDQYSMLKDLQLIFNNVILLNNQDPDVVVKNTPKDGLVQRFHMINYPPHSGEISLHIDPICVSEVNSGIYLTQFGVDYTQGGFYVLNSNGVRINLDAEVALGDLILFYPGLPHGVLSVIPPSDKIMSKGRFFFNMNLIQSHESPDRLTSQGLD